MIRCCPCGKTPEKLLVFGADHTGGKWAWVQGDCCGEWSIEFRLMYENMDSPKARELALEAWNGAPRAVNMK
jgi:hypothetical protein